MLTNQRICWMAGGIRDLPVDVEGPVNLPKSLDVEGPVNLRDCRW
ncbi:hypothetical protein [Ancylothrix sp. D3o]|nr:hypothetical protein [Ancylothrix sp. D3o]